MGIKSIDKKAARREYLHSISRLVDRMKDMKKDADRMERDAEHIRIDAKNLKDDLEKVQSAVEAFLNDNLKQGGEDVKLSTR